MTGRWAVTGLSWQPLIASRANPLSGKPLPSPRSPDPSSGHPYRPLHDDGSWDDNQWRWGNDHRWRHKYAWWNHDRTGAYDRHTEAEEKPAVRGRSRRKEHDERQREANNHCLPHGQSPSANLPFPSGGKPYISLLRYTHKAIPGKGIPNAGAIDERRSPPLVRTCSTCHHPAELISYSPARRLGTTPGRAI